MTEEEKKRAEKLAKMHEADSRTDLEMGHPIEVGKDPLIGAPAVAAQEEKTFKTLKDLSSIYIILSLAMVILKLCMELI